MKQKHPLYIPNGLDPVHSVEPSLQAGAGVAVHGAGSSWLLLQMLGGLRWSALEQRDGLIRRQRCWHQSDTEPTHTQTELAIYHSGGCFSALKAQKPRKTSLPITAIAVSLLMRCVKSLPFTWCCISSGQPVGFKDLFTKVILIFSPPPHFHLFFYPLWLEMSAWVNIHLSQQETTVSQVSSSSRILLQ